jgi:hypothetical protein
MGNEFEFIKKLIELGDNEGATKELSRIIRATPQNIDAWLYLAKVVDDPKKKADCFRQVLRLDPNNQDAANELKKLLTPNTKPSVNNSEPMSNNSKPGQQDEDKKAYQGKLVSCPKCGKENRLYAVVCANCGAQLTGSNISGSVSQGATFVRPLPQIPSNNTSESSLGFYVKSTSVAIGIIMLLVLAVGALLYTAYRIELSKQAQLAVPTQVHVKAVSTSTVMRQPSNTPRPSITATPADTATSYPSPTAIRIFDGPPRKYVPSTTAGMPSDFSASDIKEFDLSKGGSVYEISFGPWEWNVGDKHILTEVNYVVFVGDNIDRAVEVYKKSKENYSVDDQWTSYKWIPNTEMDGRFDESGGFSGRRKQSAYGEVGRLIRHGNIVALIVVQGKGSEKIMPTLEKELLFYTGLVIERLP